MSESIPYPSIRDTLRVYQIDPKRSLGQNFLRDLNYLNLIMEAAEIACDDSILEVGPGLGVLTHRLAAYAQQVVAIELDDRLIPVLRGLFGTREHVSIVHGDILESEPAGFFAEPAKPGYKIVANLPYYITSPVLRHLLEAQPAPELIVVMVQKEVAERICATPGDLSILAVSVQFYAEPEIICTVPATAFYPRPKVDSAILKLNVRAEPLFADLDPHHFFRVVRAGFGQKRKQLLNSLAAGLHLSKNEARTALERAEIDPRRRAQTLAQDEWARLCRTINN